MNVPLGSNVKTATPVMVALSGIAPSARRIAWPSMLFWRIQISFPPGRVALPKMRASTAVACCFSFAETWL